MVKINQRKTTFLTNLKTYSNLLSTDFRNNNFNGNSNFNENLTIEIYNLDSCILIEIAITIEIAIEIIFYAKDNLNRF